MMLNHPFREFPGRPWVQFSLARQEFRDQYETYMNALGKFLDWLVDSGGLQDLEIAVGMGWDTERMNTWGGILGNVFWGKFGSLGVQRLVIDMPAFRQAGVVLRGIEDGVKFPSLEHFTINARYDRGCYKHIPYVSHHVSDFFARLPNLKSYEFCASRPLKTQPVPPFFPTVNTLTSLTLSHMVLHQSYSTFLELMEFLHRLKFIKLSMIAINLPNLYTHVPDPMIAPPTAWANLLLKLPNLLPDLIDISLDVLFYGSALAWVGQSSRPAHVLIFIPPSCWNKPGPDYIWPENLEGVALLSPFTPDWNALTGLKSEILRRRKEKGLHDGEVGRVDTSTWKTFGKGAWTAVTDRGALE
ncbi:hypothetical protein ABW19_dt0205528 [Dactylella cylindrospora]|nr:hypothetical protein ABW19_dt0205528 [Dactylella cylindrospora]